MPSLDGYSLNEKIDKLHLEIKEEVVKLREEFTALYKYIKDSQIKETKVEASKKGKQEASKKEKASAKKA
tara:strand:+ start:629 stop:838 length:210 start_codon:yes stop_codon:yes gene_type:complete